MSDSLVPPVPPQSFWSMEELGRRFVEAWAPERLTEPGEFPVWDSFEFLSKKYPRLCTGVSDLPAGVEGMCWPDGRVMLGSSTYEQMVAGDGRARFTTIHEICHGIYHSAHIPRALVETGRVKMFRRSTVPAYLDPEWQADKFASAVLMPASAVKIVIANHLDAQRRAIRLERWRLGTIPMAMQRAFGVSYRAAEVRLKILREKGVIETVS